MNERLKKLRKTLHLTQKAFAERIGAKQNTIATYEMGRNNPSDPVIHSICIAFCVNENWLRNGDGEMFLTPATFSLDEYAKANKLNETEISIIRNFMELDPETRQSIYNIFANAFTKDDTTTQDKPQKSKETYSSFDENDILKYDEIPTAAEIEANYSPISADDLEKGKNIG